MRRPDRWPLAAAISLKPAVALAAAFLDPGCLAGHSAAGLPWAVPTIFALVFLGRGWRLFGDEAIKWRLLSWAYLLGASALSSTPLTRAGWVRPVDWEIVPLAVLSVLLIFEARAAVRSRYFRYVALGIGTAAATIFAVAVPYAPAIPELWPALVLGAGYGSLSVLLFADLYAHHHTRRPHAATR